MKRIIALAFVPSTSIDLTYAMKQNPSMVKFKEDLAKFVRGEH